MEFQTVNGAGIVMSGNQGKKNNNKKGTIKKNINLKKN